MSSRPLAIVGTGMVTGVGLSAPASCAAIRCGIDGFKETRFMDSGGEWIIGCQVPLEQPWRGTAKLVKMFVMALRECAERRPGLEFSATPIILCLSEESRPGGLENLVQEVCDGIQDELDLRFHADSQIVTEGRVGFAVGLHHARKLVYEKGLANVIVAGVDSYLVGPILADLDKRERLFTSQNSNGFIPGEAAAAILVQAPGHSDTQLLCTGVGFGVEQATEDSEEPLRADGLVKAIKGALADAGCDLGDLDFRITDISGSQYQFKEASLALSRILRKRKEEFDIWHPADCIGDVGAAIGGVMLAVIDAACRKGYSKGHRILFHMGNEDGKRVAMVCAFSKTAA